jgi:hypothetical protein
MPRILAATIALGVFVIVGSPLAHAAGDPFGRCKEAKAKAAGKKAFDLLKAFGKNIKKENPGKLESAILKAQSKFTKGFTKAESKGECQTSGDSDAIEAKVDAFVQDVVADVVPPHFLDNGDGTIRDTYTALMWEKKDDNDVGGIHDTDNMYTWAGECTIGGVFCQPNAAAAAACSTQTGGAYGCAECSSGTCDVDPYGRGAITTIWDWLAADMNTPPGFAGYTDWRIPEVNLHGGAEELERILYEPYPCGIDPCVDPLFDSDCTPGCTANTCSCTASATYWSSITYDDPAFARHVWFKNGYTGIATAKSIPYRVRAVRGGF